MGGVYSSAFHDEVVRDLSHSELQALQRATHYTVEELVQLKTQFLADVPEGAVTPDIFANAAFLFGMSTPALVSMLFRAFDMNDDGMITFFEFARGMSIMTRGTTPERLLFAFDMYDVERQGELRMDTVLPVLQGIEAAFGPFVRYDDQSGSNSSAIHAMTHRPASAMDVARRMFEKGPTMSRDAFRDYALANPSVVRGLALGVGP